MGLEKYLFSNYSPVMKVTMSPGVLGHHSMNLMAFSGIGKSFSVIAAVPLCSDDDTL